MVDSLTSNSEVQEKSIQIVKLNQEHIMDSIALTNAKIFEQFQNISSTMETLQQ